MTLRNRLWTVGCLLCLVLFWSPGRCQAPAGRTFSLPTGLPSGDPINDHIWVTFYRAEHVLGPARAVILLHPLGEARNRIMDRFARYLSSRGITGVAVILPYHMQRLSRGENPLNRFAGRNVDRVRQAFEQSIADVCVVTDWLARQPEVDPRRIGIIGVSLGAILTHIAMGQDSRLTAGVAIIGSGDLPDLYRRSILYRILHPSATRPLTPEELTLIRRIDPLTYADRNKPRHVLMIQAARDLIIPPSDAAELWEALARPPIVWLDTNHFGPVLGAESIMRASTDYLKSV